MGKDERNRIQTGMRGMGRGFAPTLDDIEALRARQRQSEKGAQPAPKQPFATYLAQQPPEPVAERPKQQQQQGQDDPEPAEQQPAEQSLAEPAAPAGSEPAPKTTPDAARLEHTGRVLGAQLMARLPAGQRPQPARQGRPKVLAADKKGPSELPPGPAGRSKIRG